MNHLTGRYTTRFEEDPQTGDLMLPLPDEFLKKKIGGQEID
jgi:hypothetical protein